MANTEAIAKLVVWTMSPSPPERIHSILERLEDADLLLLMTHFGGKPGRIAWAEYGKRSGYADFTLHVQQVTGTQQEVCDLLFEAEALPLHDIPVLTARGRGEQ